MTGKETSMIHGDSPLFASVDIDPLLDQNGEGIIKEMTCDRIAVRKL